jgi:hypothetical protein
MNSPPLRQKIHMLVSFLYVFLIHDYDILTYQRTVFGIGLELLLQRQTGVPVPPGSIPVVIDQCLREVELRGLTEVGICKCPPVSSRSLVANVYM